MSGIILDPTGVSTRCSVWCEMYGNAVFVRSGVGGGDGSEMESSKLRKSSPDPDVCSSAVTKSASEATDVAVFGVCAPEPMDWKSAES
eukprot:3166502-Rhodomonas_salina.2